MRREVVTAINRTKVELKRGGDAKLEMQFTLSIVPKWN